MNTKGNTTGMIVAIIILSAVVLLLLIMNYASRECNNNKGCDDGFYCGSDFVCHEFPNTAQKKESSLAIPALIVGIALVLAALILKGKISFLKEKEVLKEIEEKK